MLGPFGAETLAGAIERAMNTKLLQLAMRYRNL